MTGTTPKKDIGNRISRVLTRLVDEWVRGIEWDELHEIECEFFANCGCGENFHSVKAGYPDEPSHLRCPNCGAKGYGGPVNDR